MTKLDGPAIYFSARCILGAVFIWASIDKIMDPAAFAEIVYNYKILPPMFVNVAALVLPWVELIAGALLILGVFPFANSAILTGLVLVFAAALSFNLVRGLDFQCGCFTTSREAAHVGYMTLIRDAVLIVPAAICLDASYSRLFRNRREK